MRRTAASVLTASLIVLGACARVPPGSEVEVDLGDGTLVPSVRTVAAGEVTLEAENDGSLTHTLVVTGQDGHVIGASGLIAPGAAEELRLSLSPGLYHLTCRIVAQTEDGNLMDHFQLGMRSTLRVEA